MTVSAARRQPAVRISWPVVVCALTGFAVFQFAGNATRGYIDTPSLFYWWGYQWINPQSDCQHGWLILGLTFWLLWRNLTEGGGRLAGAPAPAPIAALSAMLGGLALHLVGYAVQQTRISIAAFLLFTWGVLVLAGGRRWGRAAVFPLAFMVFAIPVDVLDTLGFYLQMGVTGAASGIAHALGIDVVRNGTQLFSPHGGYQYDVAAACSGVRSLMALAALSLLVGYLSLRAWWARLVLLVLCGPFTFIGNVVRTTAIVVAAEWFGQRAGNVVHEWFGFVVFGIVLGLQLLAVKAFQYRRAESGDSRAGPRVRAAQDAETGIRIPETGGQTSESGEQKPRTEDRGTDTENRKSKIENWRFPRGAITAVVVLAAALVVFAEHRLDTVQTRPEVGIATAANGRDPADLPSFLADGWIGQDVPVSAIEHEVLPPDTGFARKNYVWLHGPARQVFMSIVLSGRDRTSIHRPELCLEGQGWTITGRFGHDFVYPGSGRGKVPATVLRVRREVVSARGGRVVVPSLVAYWFVGRDRVVASHWARMWWSAVDRLEHWQSSRWAYVLVQTNSTDGEDAALARLQTVLDQTLPALQRPRG